jgi:hypothetical protein
MHILRYLDAPKSIFETEKTLITLSSGQICKNQIKNQKTQKTRNPKKNLWAGI